MFHRLSRPVVSLVLALTATLSFSVAADAMSFRAVEIGDADLCGGPCPAAIAASGQITQDTPSAFLDFIERNGSRTFNSVLLIDSPGGKVMASMEFGTLLRKLGTTAVVASVSADSSGAGVITGGDCLSACVYALMGARKRVVPRQSVVGIHRMFVYEEGVDADGTTMLRQRRFDDGHMRDFLMRYSSLMGVNPALIAAAERFPSDRIRILSQSEIRRWRLGVPRL